jgi:hypothetical protein
LLTESKKSRTLTRREKELVELLVASAESFCLTRELERLEVEPMSDGEMGSLYFVHPEKGRRERRFGRSIAQTEFTDDDGVVVSATLNVDEDGDLFELDVWKADFSPVTCLRG